MNTCRILVDSFADKGLTNAQMGNAREIVRRLDPDRFHVSMFHLSEPDPDIAGRPNTTLVRLPKRRQTPWIFERFMRGRHDIIFYLKASPAAKWYLKLRNARPPKCVIVGTIESRCDWRIQSDIVPEAVSLWEQTVLRSDKLFSNSRAVKRNLEQEYGFVSDIVPTGVDTKFFTPPECRTKRCRLRVLFVGSLRPLKRPGVVLDAAAQSPQADFVIVGDGSLMPVLHERIERERLTNVALTGVLAPQLLKREYQSSDVFFFPSMWEGSPKVILEAAASGLPVVACRNYEPETVIDGQTGFLAKDDEELFDRLKILLVSPEIRQSFGTAGRRHSEAFDWDRITRDWENVFVNTWAENRMVVRR